MSFQEARKIVAGGEDVIRGGLRIAGRAGRTGLGLAVRDAIQELPGEAEALPAGAIPYSLREIICRDQYLGNEHLAEFWPEYSRDNPSAGSRVECLGQGLGLLAHPRPKDVERSLAKPEEIRYVEALGLKVVRPRSLAGFSDEYAPDAYGLWGFGNYGDSVIEVGSFVDSIPAIAELPKTTKPWGVTEPVLKFFLALAQKLESQIKAVDQEAETVWRG